MTTPERDSSYPDIPTIKEMGYPVAIELFRGISVPKGTPGDAIKKLEAAFPQYDVVGISAKYGNNIDDFYETLFKVAYK